MIYKQFATLESKRCTDNNSSRTSEYCFLVQPSPKPSGQANLERGLPFYASFINATCSTYSWQESGDEKASIIERTRHNGYYYCAPQINQFTPHEQRPFVTGSAYLQSCNCRLDAGGRPLKARV